MGAMLSAFMSAARKASRPWGAPTKKRGYSGIWRQGTLCQHHHRRARRPAPATATATAPVPCRAVLKAITLRITRPRLPRARHPSRL